MSKRKKRIFGLILALQKKEIKKYCLRECEKFLIGSLLDDKLGELLPCDQEVCSYEEGRMEYGEFTTGEFSKDVVWLRKLKELRDLD